MVYRKEVQKCVIGFQGEVSGDAAAGFVDVAATEDGAFGWACGTACCIVLAM